MQVLAQPHLACNLLLAAVHSVQASEEPVSAYRKKWKDDLALGIEEGSLISLIRPLYQASLSLAAIFGWW